MDHGAGWEPYILRLSRTCFLGWIYTVQILHKISYQLVGIFYVDDLDRDLSVRLVQIVKFWLDFRTKHQKAVLFILKFV